LVKSKSSILFQSFTKNQNFKKSIEEFENSKNRYKTHRAAVSAYEAQASMVIADRSDLPVINIINENKNKDRQVEKMTHHIENVRRAINKLLLDKIKRPAPSPVSIFTLYILCVQ